MLQTQHLAFQAVQIDWMVTAARLRLLPLER